MPKGNHFATGKKAVKKISQRAKAAEAGRKLAKKVLFSKRTGSSTPRVEEAFLEMLDNPAPDSKTRETQLRLYTRLMEYYFGKPRESVEVSGEVKQKNVLVLPDTEKLEDWMAKHKQLEVVEKPPGSKPN